MKKVVRVREVGQLFFCPVFGMLKIQLFFTGKQLLIFFL